MRAHDKFHFLYRDSWYSPANLCRRPVPLWACASAVPLPRACSTAAAAAEAVSHGVSCSASDVASPAVVHAQVTLSRVRRPRTVDVCCILREAAHATSSRSNHHLYRRALPGCTSAQLQENLQRCYGAHIAPQCIDCGAFYPTATLPAVSPTSHLCLSAHK